MKRCIPLILIIVVASGIAACQPTPENEAVVGKGKEAMEELLKNAVKNDSSRENTNGVLVYEAPEELQYVLESEFVGAKIKVDVDARIVIPESVLPIVTASHKNITYQQIEALVELICKGEPLYERLSVESVETKDTIQKKIDFYLETMERSEDREFKNDCQRRIRDLYIQMSVAPDTYEEAKRLEGTSPKKVLINMQNYDEQDYDLAVGSSYIHGELKILAQKSSMQQIIKYEAIGRYPIESIYLPEIMNDFEMNVDDALNAAEQYVGILGTGLVLTDITPALIRDGTDYSPYGYTLIYVREFSGIRSNYAIDDTSWKYQSDAEIQTIGDITVGSDGVFEQEIENETYKEPYSQETLVITIGIDGIESLTYTNPMQVNEVIVADSELLSFEKVKEIFDNYIVLNGFDASREVLLQIDRIQLGMMRIDKPNEAGEFLIVPVWDFYGYYIISKYNEGLDDNSNPKKTYGQSFLTINAIDGSIIDRSLGY